MPEQPEVMTEGQRLQNRAFFAILYSLGLFVLAWATYPYSPLAVIAAWILTWQLSSRKRRAELREAERMVQDYLKAEKQYLDEHRN